MQLIPGDGVAQLQDGARHYLRPLVLAERRDYIDHCRCHWARASGNVTTAGFSSRRNIWDVSGSYATIFQSIFWRSFAQSVSQPGPPIQLQLPCFTRVRD